MVDTQLPRRLFEAYGVSSGGRKPYHAFSLSGGALHSWKTLDGDFSEHRGTFEGGAPSWTAAAPVYLPYDADDAVGPGSVAWKDAFSETLVCWDVVGGVLHTYTPAGGRLVSHPYWMQGRLHWIENNRNSTGSLTEFSLNLSAGDFTGQVVSLRHSVQGSGLAQEWFLESTIYLSQGGFSMHRTNIDAINFEEIETWGIRLLLSGSGSATAIDPEVSPEFVPPVGLDGAGLAYGAFDGQLLKHSSDLAASWVPAWPSQGPWQLDAALSVCITQGQPQEAVLFGERGGERVAIRSGVGSQGTPDKTFTVAEHPEVSAPADLLYSVEP